GALPYRAKTLFSPAPGVGRGSPLKATYAGMAPR
ncbi:hypothetical protein MUNTM_10280, partial [Mycobacterium sp. MUNTM1]